MHIDAKSCSLPLSPEFITALNEIVANHKNSEEANVTPIAISLKDPAYSLERGGYRPQEIRIRKDGALAYCTEFTYFGKGPFAELGKAIDFDFDLGVFGHMGHDFPLSKGKELFRVWQENTTAYYRMGVYRVTVSQD